MREASEVIELEKQRDEARQIVRDIWWMARRYADNRNTYAPSMFNSAIDKAISGGWIFDSDNGKIYAEEPSQPHNTKQPEE